jgi:hypothetical protein
VPLTSTRALAFTRASSRLPASPHGAYLATEQLPSWLGPLPDIALASLDQGVPGILEEGDRVIEGEVSRLHLTTQPHPQGRQHLQFLVLQGCVATPLPLNGIKFLNNQSLRGA